MKFLEKLCDPEQTPIPDVVGELEGWAQGLSIPNPVEALSDAADAINEGEPQQALRKDAEIVGLDPKLLLLLIFGVASVAIGAQGSVNGSSVSSQPDKQPISTQSVHDIVFRGVGFNKKPDDNHPPGCDTSAVTGLLSQAVRQKEGLRDGQKLFMEKDNKNPNLGWWCNSAGQRIIIPSKK